MKCLFLYNPQSGKGKIAKKEKYITSFLEKTFDKLVVFRTQAKGDVTKEILKSGEKFDTIVVAGGDGTISEAVNGIMHLEKKPSLAILPFGTVNDVAHSLKIPTNTKKALNVIAKGTAKPHDVIKVNDSYGIYVFGGGALTETSYNTSQKAKKKFGRVAYGVYGLKKMFKTKNKSFTFTVDGKKISSKASLFLFINSKYVAGFKIDPNNDYSDQKGSFVLIESDSEKVKLSQLFKIARLFLCGYKNFKDKMLVKAKATKVKIESLEPYDFNLDGEIFSASSATIEIVPGLKIISYETKT